MTIYFDMIIISNSTRVSHFRPPICAHGAIKCSYITIVVCLKENRQLLS